MKRREFISKSALIGLAPRINLRDAFPNLNDLENGNTYPSHILDIHSVIDDPLAAPFFQLASVSPILEGYQEFPGGKKKHPDWYYPHFDIENGFIKVPTGPGLGLEYDESIFQKAKIINS